MWKKKEIYEISTDFRLCYTQTALGMMRGFLRTTLLEVGCKKDFVFYIDMIVFDLQS